MPRGRTHKHSRTFRSYAGCTASIGPGGEIVQHCPVTSKFDISAGQSHPTTRNPPTKHTTSSPPKHTSTPSSSTSGGCIAAGGEILPASQCHKLGIAPGTQSHTIGAQGQHISGGGAPTPVSGGSSTGTPVDTSGNAYITPGGEIVATPQFARDYAARNHMQYSGSIGSCQGSYNTNTGKCSGNLSIGHLDANGNFVNDAFYDPNGGFHCLNPAGCGTGFTGGENVLGLSPATMMQMMGGAFSLPPGGAQQLEGKTIGTILNDPKLRDIFTAQIKQRINDDQAFNKLIRFLLGKSSSRLISTFRVGYGALKGATTYTFANPSGGTFTVRAAPIVLDIAQSEVIGGGFNPLAIISKAFGTAPEPSALPGVGIGPILPIELQPGTQA